MQQYDLDGRITESVEENKKERVYQSIQENSLPLQIAKIRRHQFPSPLLKDLQHTDNKLDMIHNRHLRQTMAHDLFGKNPGLYKEDKNHEKNSLHFNIMNIGTKMDTQSPNAYYENMGRGMKRNVHFKPSLMESTGVLLEVEPPQMFPWQQRNIMNYAKLPDPTSYQAPEDDTGSITIWSLPFEPSLQTNAGVMSEVDPPKIKQTKTKEF